MYIDGKLHNHKITLCQVLKLSTFDTGFSNPLYNGWKTYKYRHGIAQTAWSFLYFQERQKWSPQKLPGLYDPTNTYWSVLRGVCVTHTGSKVMVINS